MDKIKEKEAVENTEEWNGLIYRLKINDVVDSELYDELYKLPVSLRSKRLLALATLGLAMSNGVINNKREINASKKQLHPKTEKIRKPVKKIELTNDNPVLNEENPQKNIQTYTSISENNYTENKVTQKVVNSQIDENEANTNNLRKRFLGSL